MAYGRTDSIFRYPGAAIGTTKWARRRSAPDWPFMSDAEFKSSFKNKISKWETGYKQTPQIKTTGPSATPPTASTPAPRTAPWNQAATQEEARGPQTTRARAPWDAATQAPQTKSRA